MLRNAIEDSIRAVTAASDDVRLTIIGEGEQKARLQALVESLRVSHRIQFIHAMPYGPELHRQLRMADTL